MAGLSGQTAGKRTYAIDAIANEVKQIYRKSFQDAVSVETRLMNTQLDRTLRNVTFRQVYDYPAQNPNRRYYHGGLADAQYYSLEAKIHGDGEMQIVFLQESEIPHESYDDDAENAIAGYDTRMIVEEGSIFFRQPKPRPYFDDVANELARSLPQNIESRIQKSMRMRGF